MYRRVASIALLVGILAACSSSKGLSTGDQVALATKLAHESCVGTPDVATDGSATCDESTSIAVWASASERDAHIATTRVGLQGGPGSFVEGATWFIVCAPADAARIAAATGGKSLT